ncbi:MAG: PEP-utilizing enzyme [Nitrososphaerota archaeon]
MLHYAYDYSFYEFDDEKDIESYGVLLCDVVHGKPPMKPLYIGIGWYWYYHAIRWAAETLCLPTTKGWDSRFINGYPYITSIRTTENERKEREPIFREKIRPFLTDFISLWNRDKLTLLQEYESLKKKYNLIRWEDIKQLSNIQLLSMFLDWAFETNRKEAEYHFLYMIAANYINGTFQNWWRDVFKEEPTVSEEFNVLQRGIEEEVSEQKVFFELWKLAQDAKNMGLGQLFEKAEPNGILKELEGSEIGEKWLVKLDEFLLKHGWRCERMHAYDTPSWLEKRELPLMYIKLFLPQDEFLPTRNTQEFIKQRELLIKNIEKRLNPAQKEVFLILAKASRGAAYFSEDHTYYCDLYIGALGRWITSEFGRRFAEAGVIDEPEDVYFLTPNEIRKAAIPMSKVSLRPYVEKRKAFWKKALETEPLPYYGDISLAQDVLRSDPTLQVSTQLPIVREELKADLYGAASAPGVAEGVARVITSVDQLSELRPGEILVAPGVSTEWVAAFGIIKGLVTDGGSALSHPVIMSREYGIPCVAGCLEATKKIKTGMRIRVDGTKGVVYILTK